MRQLSTNIQTEYNLVLFNKLIAMITKQGSLIMPADMQLSSSPQVCAVFKNNNQLVVFNGIGC